MVQRSVFHVHDDYAGCTDWQTWLQSLSARPAVEDIVRVLKDARNKVYHMRHDERDVVVKYFCNNGVGKKIAYRIRSSKAQRSFLHGQKLRDAGLHSPQVIAWREDWRGIWLQQSFFVSALVDERFTGWSLKDKSIPDVTMHLQDLARAIAQMHDAQLCHRDLTPGNIIFTGEELQLQFIDCNRMSFGMISREMGLRSLVQMGFAGEHIDPYVAAYAEARGFDSEYCQQRYRTLLQRHGFKWKIKNATRPWRRRIGL